MLECGLLSLDISPLHFFSWNLLNEDICADDSKTVKELKDVIVSELGHLHIQMVDKAVKYPGTTRLPALTLQCTREIKLDRLL